MLVKSHLIGGVLHTDRCGTDLSASPLRTPLTEGKGPRGFPYLFDTEDISSSAYLY